MKRLFLLFLFLTPFNAIAGSDGVFCVGKGYVALEARGRNVFDAIGMGGNVKRTKVYIDKKSGNDKDGVFIIFASHGVLTERKFVPVDFSENMNRKISCEDNRVILTDGFQSNIIDVSSKNNLVAEKAKVEKTNNYSNMQLPYMRKSEAIKIPAAVEERDAYQHQMPMPISIVEAEFWLIIDAFEQSHSAGYIVHHFSARVVQLGKWGSFINSTRLADGIKVETVDPY